MTLDPAPLETPAVPPAPEDLRGRKKREIALAAPYRGSLAWRIVAEALWGFGGWAAVIALAIAGMLP